MSFQVRLKLTNSTQHTVAPTVPAGTVFEGLDPFSRIQNLLTAKSVSISLPPGSTEVIEIDSWCLNKSFSPPRRTSLRPTPFRSVRQYSSQSHVWGDLGRRR